MTFDSSWFTDEGLRFGASGTGRRNLERGRGFKVGGIPCRYSAGAYI